MNDYQVIVIGGGPAGMAAALAAHDAGARTLLIEREARLGGVLKQCIHDGFGLLRFQEALTGPEYADRDREAVEARDIETLTQTFVTRIEKSDSGFRLTAVNRQGLHYFETRALVLATGCRERTARQVAIHGTRPSGILTAGTAQYYVNLLGQMPTRRCLILGSGDIGLIMARRLTLEGAQVLGVYEAKSRPSGLARNLHQCLDDFDIPLHLSSTVTRVLGEDRLTAVEVARVDQSLRPIPGTESVIECDCLILSVGLIPENELAESLEIRLDPASLGPVCDQEGMTSLEGVFSCGNALHVNDLVDYVSQSGQAAGRAAALYQPGPRTCLTLEKGQALQTLVPQTIRLETLGPETVFYFRSREDWGKSALVIRLNGQEVARKAYPALHPPQMESLTLDLAAWDLEPDSRLTFDIEGRPL